MDDFEDVVSPIVTVCMTRKFIPDCLEIERQSFPFPWTNEHFESSIKEKNCNGIVASIRDIVCGFAVYETRPDSIVIINFAIGLDWRLSGIGRDIFSKIVRRAKDTSREKVFVGISEYHIGGQYFLKSMGCRCIQCVHATHEDIKEDCLLFELDVPMNSPD